MNKINYWFWVLFTAIITTIVPISVQYYIKYKKLWFFIILAILASALLIFGYYKIFLEKFISSFAISKIISVIIIFFYGIIVFKEKISIKNYFGIFASLITIYLLS